MAHPGQPAPPEQTPNTDQGMDSGTLPRHSNQYGDISDPMLDSNERQTLEHGGYGGEQEYMDEPTTAAQPRSTADATEGTYVNQTDMTDQTGDRSQSKSVRQSRQLGQGQSGDTGIAGETG